MRRPCCAPALPAAQLCRSFSDAMPTAAPFHSDKDALAWLYGTQLFGVKLGLDNVRRLLDALHLPGDGMRFIHVAGTNGKGSTCAFAHQLLLGAGQTAGLFTSPHLIRYHERIRDGAREISSDELVAGLNRLRAVIDGWEPHPTFFELTLALALDWFHQRQVQWVVLETGLGGRLDATNALTPAVAVITPIGLDHTEVLGSSLAQIAAEKAGIIKPGVPIATSPQSEEAMAVLRRVAAEENAPLQVVSAPWHGVEPSLAGAHQRWNAALAIAAVQAAGVALTERQCAGAVQKTRWAGRFQRLGPAGRLVVDGAHNADSARALAATWREVFGDEKAELLLGMVQGKDHRAIIDQLTPIAQRWHLAPFQSPRAMSVAELRPLLEATGIEVIPHRSLTAALDHLAAPAHPPALVAGSLFLAGEALDCLARTGSFEVSWQ